MGRVLTAVVATLMLAASAAGLLVDGVYRDADAVVAMFRGHDLITLLIAVPLLVATLRPSVRTSARARLLQAGVLAYATYDYALYVFGGAFNDLFLVHVATFSSAAFGLGFVLSDLDISRIGRRFGPRTPVRSVSAILAVLALSLAAMWVTASVRFAVTGELPQEASELILPIGFTHLGYVLDLGLLVPGYALAAVLLWRRAPWGYVLATTLLVGGLLQQITYMTALVFQARADIASATAFDPVEPVIVIAYLAAAAALLLNLGPVATVRSGRGEIDTGGGAV